MEDSLALCLRAMQDWTPFCLGHDTRGARETGRCEDVHRGDGTLGATTAIQARCLSDGGGSYSSWR